MYTREQLDKAEFYLYYGDMHFPYDVMSLPLRRLTIFIEELNEINSKKAEAAEKAKARK